MPTRAVHQLPVPGQNDGELRLSTTDSGSLSRLEIYHSSSWGPVCAQNWGFRESLVLCTQLGFKFVGNWDRQAKGVTEFTRLGDVHCGGYETSILICQHSELGISTDCTEGLVTAYCVNYPGGTVTLRSGESFSEGRVEIFFKFKNETLVYTICDEDWDLADAQLLCKNNNYDSAIKAVGGSYFGERPPSWASNIDERFEGFLTSGVQCSASYEKILACPNSGWFPRNCPSGKTAGVICKPFSDAYQLNVFLTHGTSPYNGVVHVSINDGFIGTICDAHRDWSLRESDVLCRSLGFSYALNTSFVNASMEPSVHNIRCDGDEESLTQCNRGGDCSQRKGLAQVVNCSGPIDSNDHPVQLSNFPGTVGGKGLLRVFYDGRWGTVCSTGWIQENAEVICRQLGYDLVVDNSLVGGGTAGGPIFLSGVRCKGTERTLDECSHGEWGSHRGCSHDDDVRLECGRNTLTNDAVVIAVVVSVVAIIVITVIMIIIAVVHNKRQATPY